MKKLWNKILAIALVGMTVVHGITPNVYAEGDDPETSIDQPVDEAGASADPEISASDENDDNQESESSQEPTHAENEDASQAQELQETYEEAKADSTHAETEEEEPEEDVRWDIDFSSMRLLVFDEDPYIIRDSDPVISEYNGVYLIQYESVTDTIEGYVYYMNVAEHVTVDIMFVAAEPDDETANPEEETSEPAEETTEMNLSEPMTEENNPFKQLSDQIEEDEKEEEENEEKSSLIDLIFGNDKKEEEEVPEYTIALIDSGAGYYIEEGEEEDEKILNPAVKSAVSMIGDDVYDMNGHGSNMLKYILEEHENASVISIKALDDNAHGTVSSVYAAMEYAIETGVNVINLSISAYSTADNAIIAEEVKKANEAGIIVVGSAGNDYNNVKYYVPGNIDEAVIVGSCDSAGVKLEISNFGETVDCNVLSNSTSEAAARLSGMLSKNSIDPDNLVEWYLGIRNRDGGKLFDAEFDGESYEASGSGEFEGANVVSIDTFNTAYVSGGKTETGTGYIKRWEDGQWKKYQTGNPRYTWNANRSTPDHAFVFRVSYAMSVLQNVPARAIEIRVPLHILRDRYGNFADNVEMPVLSESEYLLDDPSNHRSDADQFAYRIEGDEIVFTNMEQLNSAPEGYFEISYSTNKTSYNYVDMGESDPFHAEVTVNGLTAESTAGAVYINTGAEITSTYKYYPSLYSVWQTSWGEAPADADDYYYLVWEVKSDINATQPYTLNFTDITTGIFGENAKKDLEVVGIKVSGSSRYENVYEFPMQTLTGARYDRVLTRHSKEDVAPIDRYTIDNEVTVKVTPVDGIDSVTQKVSKRSFSWERPEFKAPTGHFIAHKRADGAYRTYYEAYGSGVTYLTDLGMKAGVYSRYDLEEFKNGTMDAITDLDYAVWLDGYPTPWTYQERYPGVNGKSPTLNPNNYFLLPVKYELIDQGVYLSQDGGEESTRALTSEDFQIDSITWDIDCWTAQLNEETYRYDTQSVEPNSSDTITLYLKFNNNDNSWINVGTLKPETRQGSLNPTYARIENGKIIPADNCVAYRMEIQTLYYELMLKTVPKLRLKNSAYVMSQIGDVDSGWVSIAIKNDMEGHFYKMSGSNWVQITEFKESDTDFVREVQRSSELTKDAIASSNNKRKKQYTITWKAHLEEQIISGAGDEEYVEQTSGTFFDLLPAGQFVDKNSIQVRNHKGYLASSSYTVEVISNYRDTGRDLLIINIEDSGDYFDAYFDTVVSWDGINDFGRDVYNPIAYQTGNDEIKNGRPNDGGELKQDIDLMTGLPDYNPVNGDGTGKGADNPNRYLYSDEYYDIAAITQAASGLSKLVKTEDDTDYSYDTETKPNGLYSYRMRYMNSFDSESKDIVFYDSLENYAIQEIGQEDDVSDWKGIPQYFDLSQAKLMGIEPVVYISTVEHLDLSVSANKDLTNSAIWQRAGSDISAAKAVAIDLSKATDGSDYILGKGESVSLVLHMQAPDGAVSSKPRIPVTYNNIYISNNKIDDAGREVPFSVHHDYTTVRLVVKGDVNGLKVSSENSDTKIRGITFRLRGASDYGNEIDYFAVSDTRGLFKFKDVEQGSYILSEYEGIPDYLEDHTEHTVVITPAGKVMIDDEDYTELEYTVTNDPRIHADVMLIKRDSLNSRAIPGVTLKLSGTSEYGNDVILVGTTDSVGRITFPNIELGTYRLTEIATDENHILPQKDWIVTIDDNGGVTVVWDDEE